MENSTVAIGLEKVSFLSNPKERANYHTTALISHACKAMVNILLARLQQYMNQNLDTQAEFRKSRETRNQIANICWIIEKVKFQKKTYFCFIDYAKAFDSVDHNKLWKILKKMEICDHLTCLLKKPACSQEVTEPDVEQQMDSKLGKYNKAVYCHSA